MRGVQARTSIVDAGEIMQDHIIRQEIWTSLDLGFSGDSLEVLQWLARRRLIGNTLQCVDCEIPMSFIRRAKNSDGYTWKCRICGKLCSLRNNSFFSKSRLTLLKLIQILYMWSRDQPQKEIAHELKLGADSTHTVVDWCSFCRDVCHQYYVDHPTTSLNEDGTAKIAENLRIRATRNLKRRFGTTREMLPTYLEEFMWRNKFRNAPSLFSEFIIAVAEQHPV